MIDKLRREVPIEEFDYLLLMNALSSYKKPRDKVTQLIKSGAILRVKKGIYVFGPNYRKSPISLEVLANQIYGPSYISLEFALGFHNIIPERVEWVTSVTSQKSKTFETPIGHFSYRHIHPEKYIVGVENIQLDEHRYCMMASKEKALSDLLALQRDIHSKKEMLEHLTKNLRIDVEELTKFNSERMEEIDEIYKNKRVKILNQIIKELS